MTCIALEMNIWKNEEYDRGSCSFAHEWSPQGVSMGSLIGAAGFFLGIHLVISGTRIRSVIVQRTGESAYLGLFSVASLAGIVWLIHAYGQAPMIELWGQVTSMRWIAAVLMFFACLFLVLGMATPNPTAIGGENMITQGGSIRGIFRITRHPFLVGTGLWSGVHLIYNGDAAAVTFFGTFFLLSLLGPMSIDAKQRRALGDPWRQFAERTSVIPMLAIVQGRNRFHFGELGWWRLVLGFVLFAVLGYFHETLFGVVPR